MAHSLIGLALTSVAVLRPAVWSDLGREAWRRRWLLLGGVALANAPDIDYLPGLLSGDLNAYHHLITHTAGWCLLVSAGVALAARAFRRGAPMKAVLGWSLLLTGSHLLADWLTADTRPPIGIMALWPVDDRFHLAPRTIFLALQKRDFADMLQWHNVGAVVVELVWCLPLLGLALWGSRRLARRAAP